MSTRPLLPALLAPLLLPALPAQTITLAEGTASSLQIVALAESNPNGPATTVLQNVELLLLEITGRTLVAETDVTRARRVVRHGMARVELPQGGRLFRYRRAGGQHWGFLRVAADGAPQAVLELPGIALADPFADRIAVAADGRHAVIALAAGGAFAVRLDGGVFASTGRADRVLAPPAAVLEPLSVMVGPTVAFWQTVNGQLWRCGLADGALPVDVSPPPVPLGEWKDQMALSGDGTKLVFLYGPRDQQRLYLVGTSGTPVALPPPPSKYEEPGYLPEDPGEPAMLLDDAGTRLFFVDSIQRDELHLIDLAGVLPGLQITEDAIFQPYIGAHILPHFAGTALALAIGDPGQMDWFRATLAAPAGTVVNLTGTGSMQAPFPSGQLDPVQAAPAGADLLIAERSGTAMALRRLDPLTGQGAVVQQDLLAPPQVGSSATGTADVLARGTGGDRLFRGTSGALFAQTPAGVLLTPPVHGPTFAATWVHLGIGWGIVALYLPDGTVVGDRIEFGVRQLSATAPGGLVVAGTQLRYLAPGAAVVLNRPAAPVQLVLSGAGG